MISNILLILIGIVFVLFILLRFVLGRYGTAGEISSYVLIAIGVVCCIVSGSISGVVLNIEKRYLLKAEAEKEKLKNMETESESTENDLTSVCQDEQVDDRVLEKLKELEQANIIQQRKSLEERVVALNKRQCLYEILYRFLTIIGILLIVFLPMVNILGGLRSASFFNIILDSFKSESEPSTMLTVTKILGGVSFGILGLILLSSLYNIIVQFKRMTGGKAFKDYFENFDVYFKEIKDKKVAKSSIVTDIFIFIFIVLLCAVLYLSYPLFFIITQVDGTIIDMNYVLFILAEVVSFLPMIVYYGIINGGMKVGTEEQNILDHIDRLYHY